MTHRLVRAEKFVFAQPPRERAGLVELVEAGFQISRIEKEPERLQAFRSHVGLTPLLVRHYGHPIYAVTILTT